MKNLTELRIEREPPHADGAILRINEHVSTHGEIVHTRMLRPRPGRSATVAVASLPLSTMLVQVFCTRVTMPTCVARQLQTVVSSRPLRMFCYGALSSRDYSERSTRSTAHAFGTQQS